MGFAVRNCHGLENERPRGEIAVIMWEWKRFGHAWGGVLSSSFLLQPGELRPRCRSRLRQVRPSR